ncbi:MULTISPECIES: SMI1/KNR4 family protein [unclassified Streptomyces]|uniref:SMI1/KNR4 family protein n=1 Tax=unclassified Streptomyces TaxID=2593676 RepID=UPI0036687F8B
MPGDAIQSLWLKVEELGRPVAWLRSPGLERRQLVASLGESLPQDVYAWFEACNGVPFDAGQVQDDANLIPGYEPLSLRQALEIRQNRLEQDEILGEHWVPLLASGGGDFYAAVYDHPNGSYVADVIAEADSMPAYLSVEHMALAFRASYERGAFFVDDDGMLDMAVDLCDQIDGEYRIQ